MVHAAGFAYVYEKRRKGKKKMRDYMSICEIDVRTMQQTRPAGRVLEYADIVYCKAPMNGKYGTESNPYERSMVLKERRCD